MEAVGPTVVIDALTVEQPADDPDRLVEPVEPFADGRPEVDPECVVLALEPGATDPEDRPPAADVVEGCCQLGRVARVAEGVRTDHQPEPDPGRDGGPGGEGEPALEDRLAPRALDREQVVPRPDRVPAGRLSLERSLSDPRPVARLRPELGAEPGRHRSTEIRLGRKRKVIRCCLVNRSRMSSSAWAGSSAW